MLKNRFLSFILVTLVYVISTIVGVITYNSLNFHFSINLLIADVIATVVVFIFSLIFKNASVYDPYWSVQPIIILGIFVITNPFSVITLLPLIAILLWGIRLTINWAYTFKSLSHQDWRYTMLKEKTGLLYPFVNLFGIHLFPTFVVYLCVLPTIYLAKTTISFNLWSIIFLCISLIGTIIQTIADIQMHKFRKKKTGKFIRDGLWKYSRHPNYLGEIMMWWGIALYSLTNLLAYNWLIIGAVVNHLMFVFISVPLAENHQKSRKEGFDDYKNETRMFLPFHK